MKFRDRHIVLSEKGYKNSNFVTPPGKYKFKKDSFGLAQTLNYFQQVINKVFQVYHGLKLPESHTDI